MEKRKIYRDRLFLENIIKKWAQDHTVDFIIADKEVSDTGIVNTGDFFSWLIREKNVNINLLGLVDLIDYHFQIKYHKKALDGMFCIKCKNFHKFAEPNQDDETLICYSCRTIV